MCVGDLTMRMKFKLAAIPHAVVITYKVVSVNNLQRGDISNLHKLRYYHLVTTSRQMPKRMRDRAEQLTNSPKQTQVKHSTLPSTIKFIRCKTKSEYSTSPNFESEYVPVLESL